MTFIIALTRGFCYLEPCSPGEGLMNCSLKKTPIFIFCRNLWDTFNTKTLALLSHRQCRCCKLVVNHLWIYSRTSASYWRDSYWIVPGGVMLCPQRFFKTALVPSPTMFQSTNKLIFLQVHCKILQRLRLQRRILTVKSVFHEFSIRGQIFEQSLIWKRLV